MVFWIFELLEFGDFGGLDFWISFYFLELWILGYWEMRVCYTLAMYGSIGLCGHTHTEEYTSCQPASQPANCQAAGCWPLVEISKHKQANSTSLAYNQKPQLQLQQNGQAVVLGQWQNFQPSNLAGPAGRPSPNVEISATVQAPLLGHIVAAMVVASD